ncbi:hypothetical protein ETH_00040610, partial [Eimeria tenella]
NSSLLMGCRTPESGKEKALMRRFKAPTRVLAIVGGPAAAAAAAPMSAQQQQQQAAASRRQKAAARKREDAKPDHHHPQQQQQQQQQHMQGLGIHGGGEAPPPHLGNKAAPHLSL